MSTTKYGRAVRTLGTGFTQDKAVELYRNVADFVQKNLPEDEEEDRVFVCRLALKTCFVLASNKTILKYLNESNDDHFYNGLQDFFFGLFGQSILFADANEAKQLRNVLLPLFTAKENLDQYEVEMKDLVQYWIDDLHDSAEFYNEFKRLSLAVNLKIFLGIDLRSQPEFFETISSLATTHWHGIISVPVNVKLSFLASSSYRKAVDAKNQLIEITRERLASNQVSFLNKMKETTGMEEDLLLNHMLVFICALIPKATASILSSFVDTIHLWKHLVNEQGELSDENVEMIILEIIRLWPPFVGGLKVAKCDTDVDGYKIPKGHGVFYVSLVAHRDPQVFPYPEKFMPERWNTCNADDRDKIFGFGSGLHRCIGEQFMWKFFLDVTTKLVKSFNWESNYKEKERKIKYLPVSRPVELEKTNITRR